MKGKLVAVLFVIVFVLLIAVVFSLLNDNSSTDDISSFRLQSKQTDGGIVSTIETPPVTVAPETTWLPNPTAEPTPVPATPAPTPVPTATPVPTPTPAPVNTVIGSGTFESKSGTYIDITADWTAMTVSDTQVDITFKVNAKSYALDYTGFPDAIHIAVGDKYESCAANTIGYTGSAQTLNELATHTISVNLPAGSSNTFNIQVVWDFNGVYGSPTMGPVPITSLECGGTITLSR